jgi:hypothetical protein
MWLLSGVAEDPEDETVMEMHGANTLYCAVRSLMHTFRTENHDAHRDAAHRMIKIATPRTISRWSEWKLANARTMVRIPKGNAHLVDLESTEDA